MLSKPHPTVQGPSGLTNDVFGPVEPGKLFPDIRKLRAPPSKPNLQLKPRWGASNFARFLPSQKSFRNDFSLFLSSFFPSALFAQFKPFRRLAAANHLHHEVPQSSLFFHFSLPPFLTPRSKLCSSWIPSNLRPPSCLRPLSQLRKIKKKDAS